MLVNTNCGVYKITVKYSDGNKVYVGSSRNLETRELTHFNSLKNGRHHNKGLQEAFDLIGRSGFVFEVIEWCDRPSLRKKELEYILSLKSHLPEYGFNIQGGGKKKFIAYLMNVYDFDLWNRMIALSKANGRSLNKEINIAIAESVRNP